MPRHLPLNAVSSSGWGFHAGHAQQSCEVGGLYLHLIDSLSEERWAHPESQLESNRTEIQSHVWPHARILHMMLLRAAHPHKEV